MLLGSSSKDVLFVQVYVDFDSCRHMQPSIRERADKQLPSLTAIPARATKHLEGPPRHAGRKESASNWQDHHFNNLEKQ